MSFIDRQKSQLSSNDSESFSIKSMKYIHQKQLNKLSASSHSCDKLLINNPTNMLSSISRKLKARNIQVLSKRKEELSTELKSMERSVSITCNDKFQPFQYFSSNCKIIPLTFDILKDKIKNKKIFLQNVHGNNGDKKGCTEQNCILRTKWTKKVGFYEREIKNLYILKQKINLCSQNIRQQIQKDVPRTFTQKILTRTRIFVSQSKTQKVNLIQCLKQVLKLYVVYDNEVGYVQGMNFIVSAIAFHMKQVNQTFIFFKYLMNNAQLRNFYIEDFYYLKKQTQITLFGHLKQLDLQLHEYLIDNNVDSLMFVQHYMTLFISLVDIQFCHIIIDEYIRDGITFLHKLMISLLFYLKPYIMIVGENDNVITKIGPSFIRSLNIQWENIILCAMEIQIA